MKRGADADAVRAPDRVQRVIDRACALASSQQGADPGVVAATYRAMISAFIDLELDVQGESQR